MASPWRWRGKPLLLLYLIALHPYGLRGAADWLEDGELLCVNSTVDAAAFEDAVSQRDYARALELHRGALLEGVQVRTATDFQDWLDVERMRLQELLLEALRGRSVELNDVQPLEALRIVERWQIIDPLSEDALQAALKLELHLGRRAAALLRVSALAAR